MTPSQLRQGAALVRALVEGDETARGPLSDFLLSVELLDDYWVEVLRMPNVIIRVDTYYENTRHCWMATEQCPDLYLHALGTWPAWAWNGTEATAERGGG